MLDPFDFSDFGSPSPPNGRSTLQPPRPGPKLDTGFDPFADAQPRVVKSVDAFGTTTPATADSDSLRLAGPPLSLLGLAVVLAVTGASLAGVWGGGAVITTAIGWSLAGPVAIGVLAFYTLVDTRRRTEAVYSAPNWAATAYWAVVLVCMAGITISAWYLALWAGRR
jgi:hypothetical protein